MIRVEQKNLQSIQVEGKESEGKESEGKERKKERKRERETEREREREREREKYGEGKLPCFVVVRLPFAHTHTLLVSLSLPLSPSVSVSIHLHLNGQVRNKKTKRRTIGGIITDYLLEKVRGGAEQTRNSYPRLRIKEDRQCGLVERVKPKFIDYHHSQRFRTCPFRCR